MPKPRTNAGWPIAILIAIVLLPVGYMGAYYGMMRIEVTTDGPKIQLDKFARVPVPR